MLESLLRERLKHQCRHSLCSKLWLIQCASNIRPKRCSMFVVCQEMINASGGYSNCQDLKVNIWARSPSSKGMLSMLPRPGDSGDLGGVPRSDTSAAHRTLTLQCRANIVCYHPISQLQYSVKAFQAFRQIRVWKTLMIMLPF